MTITITTTLFALSVIAGFCAGGLFGAVMVMLVSCKPKETFMYMGREYDASKWEKVPDPFDPPRPGFKQDMTVRRRIPDHDDCAVGRSRRGVRI